MSSAVPWGGDLDAADLVTLGVADRLTVSGGAAFAYGEVGYIHTDGTVRKAQADGTAAEAEAKVICINSTSVASGSAGLFRIAPGRVPGLSGGTAGSPGYVSDTAGAITTTAPTTAGRYSKILGDWQSATVFYFNPDRNTPQIPAY